MHVAVTTPSNGSGAPIFGLTLVRMIGFRKMMYDMTMKVVMPAIVSRASVVPCAANWNRRSRIDSRNVAAIVLIETFLPFERSAREGQNLFRQPVEVPESRRPVDPQFAHFSRRRARHARARHARRETATREKSQDFSR